MGGRNGEAEQLGTDLQTDRFGSGVIDLEPDLILLADEIDDTAGPDKSFGLADRQNRRIMQARNDFRISLFLGIADEQDVAFGRFGKVTDGFDLQRMAVDGLVLDDLIQFISEFIFPHDANHNRRIRVGKCLWRPLDELRKIVDECRLQPVFRQRSILPPRREKKETQHQEPDPCPVFGFRYYDKKITKNRAPRPADSPNLFRFRTPLVLVRY